MWTVLFSTAYPWVAMTLPMSITVQTRTMLVKVTRCTNSVPIEAADEVLPVCSPFTLQAIVTRAEALKPCLAPSDTT